VFEALNFPYINVGKDPYILYGTLSVPSFYHMGASIVSASFTYTGVYEVKMQKCHYAFSKVTSTCFISTLKILACTLNTKTPTNAYIMHALNAHYKIIVSSVHV